MIVMLTPQPNAQMVRHEPTGSGGTYLRLVDAAPDPVEAMQFDGTNITAIAQWCGGFAMEEVFPEGARYVEDTTGTIHRLMPGDWLVCLPPYDVYADGAIDRSFIR